jgi:hypothetical protein
MQVQPTPRYTGAHAGASARQADSVVAVSHAGVDALATHACWQNSGMPWHSREHVSTHVALLPQSMVEQASSGTHAQWQ